MSNFKRGSDASLPTLSFKNTENLFVKFLEPIKYVVDGDKSINLVKVTNLMDGKVYNLICPTVLTSKMSAIGHEIYVGREYEIEAKEVPGKDYKEVTVYNLV